MEKIKEALKDLPEETSPREVQRVLSELAERDYGDVFDGVRVRVDSSSFA